jgi:putative ABC transport system substrate-binding protein
MVGSLFKTGMSTQLVRRFFTQILLCLLMAGFATVACAQSKSVSVLTIIADNASADKVTDARLSVMREGIRDALKANSFQEGKNFKLQFDSIQASGAQLDSALLRQGRLRPDVLVVISAESIATEMTLPAQTSVVQIRLLDAQSNNGAAGWGATATPVTGVSNALPIARRVALIRQLVPGARKVGVIYNPGHPQSAARAKELQEQLTAHGMVMIEAGAQRLVDVGSAARSLTSRVDVFYTLDDANAQQSYAALVKVANDAKLPLFGLDAENVRQGAVAALMVSDRDLGVQAGRMVARILRGTKSTSIPPEFSIRPQLYLNANAAQKQGVVLAETTLKSAVEVFNNVSQERTNHDRSRR